jgi:hypothetical protein
MNILNWPSSSNHYSLELGSFTSLHLIECKYYLVESHYTYAFQPIPENICILIRLTWKHFLNHATHHHAMHGTCSIFLVSLPARLQPQDLFLMPRALTFWSYTCSACKASTPRLNIQRSWFCYASAWKLSVLCVHAITHATHLISCFFINFHQYMNHINHFSIHMFSIITRKLMNLVKTSLQHTQSIHMQMLY